MCHHNYSHCEKDIATLTNAWPNSGKCWAQVALVLLTTGMGTEDIVGQNRISTIIGIVRYGINAV